MSKIIKYFIISSLLLFINYYLLLITSQNTIMTVSMSNEQNNTLKTQLFYTKNDFSFNEKDSVKTFNIQNKIYSYALPLLENIQNIRFDPSNSKQQITIKKIKIIENTWITTKTYLIPLKEIEPLYDIENLIVNQHGIKFNVTGTDPQIKINLPKKPSEIIHKFHLYTFLISLLILIIIFYLYFLYKTEIFDDKLSAKMILYSLFFFFAVFKVSYYTEHVNKFYPPDELAHLSYIEHMYSNPGLIPKFETMRTLNNKDAGLYLSHPPLYYHLMLIAYDTTYPIMSDINIKNFRNLNNIIFIFTFMLILYLSFSTKVSLLSHLVYLSIVTSIPMYAYSGASITNDNLAILGALIFILGLKRMMLLQYSNLTYFILGLGIFISYFSKLTVAILIFFAAIFFILSLYQDKKKLQISTLQLAIILTFLLPIFYYQIHIFTTYHSIMPTFNVTYPQQYLKSVFYTPEELRLHYTPIEWLERMKEYVIGGWFGIHSHHSFIKESFLGYLGLLILHFFALISLFLKCSNDKLQLFCRIGKITLLSLIMVLIIQYLFSYKTHLTSGYMGGLQPRYLLPFMFAFAIMASLFVERFKQYFVFNILIIIICVQVLYSDFFYFLQYYQ